MIQFDFNDIVTVFERSEVPFFIQEEGFEKFIIELDFDFDAILPKHIKHEQLVRLGDIPPTEVQHNHKFQEIIPQKHLRSGVKDIHEPVQRPKKDYT